MYFLPTRPELHGAYKFEVLEPNVIEITIDTNIIFRNKLFHCSGILKLEKIVISIRLHNNFREDNYILDNFDLKKLFFTTHLIAHNEIPRNFTWLWCKQILSNSARQ